MTPQHITIEDFLCDDDFIRYTLDGESDRQVKWKQYLTAPESIRKTFLQATDILLHLDECTLLSAEEIRRLKLRIGRTLQLSRSN